VGGFLARLIVTYAYICFSLRSTAPRGAASPLKRMLPYHRINSIRSFGTMLDARLLSMPCRSTSELLRTL
jgi:hypothetical protein